MSTPPICASLIRPVALLLVALLVGACGLIPTIGERAWTMSSTNQAGLEQAVEVVDASGIVKGVVFDPVDADLFGGVTVPAGEPDALDVTWITGACDTATTITITDRRPGLAIAVAITTGQAACDGFRHAPGAPADALPADPAGGGDGDPVADPGMRDARRRDRRRSAAPHSRDA